MSRKDIKTGAEIAKNHNLHRLGGLLQSCYELSDLNPNCGDPEAHLVIDEVLSYAWKVSQDDLIEGELKRKVI